MANKTTVGELVDGQQVISMPADATAFDAAQVMAEHYIGAVPVVHERELIGIFTERDLVNRVVAAGKRPEDVMLRDAMTVEPMTITRSQSLSDAMDMMASHEYRHLPVLNDEGALTGMLSCRDVPLINQFLNERWHKWREGMKTRAA
jgi:CBS domain-containing protein